MEYQIRGAEYSNVNVSPFEGGIWIRINRNCGYTSTQLTSEQTKQLRDALIALTETADAAQ